ncbi:MAG: cysteine dioxygenase [Arenicellales bacterium WSBS_2016_MAG_OTU3]
MSWDKLRDFVQATTNCIDAAKPINETVAVVKAAMTKLVAEDDWLEPEFARQDPNIYQQHLLYCDPMERFSVVSFVWGCGQKTPVHDHTVWGVIGQLRGAETSQDYGKNSSGQLVPQGAPDTFNAGDVATLGPHDVDVHLVANPTDSTSISIHTYGGNIGKVKRHVYELETGVQKTFVSGYCNTRLPNIWA